MNERREIKAAQIICKECEWMTDGVLSLAPEHYLPDRIPQPVVGETIAHHRSSARMSGIFGHDEYYVFTQGGEVRKMVVHGRVASFWRMSPAELEEVRGQYGYLSVPQE